MKKKTFGNLISITVMFLLGIFFLIKFGGPPFLRLYLETGIGDCKTIPILCMAPGENLINLGTDKEFIGKLLPYDFPKLSIRIPRGFIVVQETIKKVYYKKKKRGQAGDVIYLLHEPPYFFTTIFPHLKNAGVTNDREFLYRTMHAKLGEVKGLSDAFFVIMKSIFTPDLGDQNSVKMAYAVIADKSGFINYNLSPDTHYFDCNLIDKNGDFFKIYIKDKSAKLDLIKVFSIISTLSKH